MSGPWTTVKDVRVLEGDRVSAPRSLAIVDGVFADRPAASSPARTPVVRAGGMVLVPGLVDAHVHVDAREQLDQELSSGVTAVLDLGAHDLDRINALRDQEGAPAVRSALAPASAPGAFLTTVMGYPASTAVTGPDDAGRFVAERVAEGAGYLKIIVEDPQLPPFAVLSTATVRALADHARRHGLLSIAHTTSLTAVLTHVPLDRPVDAGLARRIAAAGIVVIPTLVMMRGVSERINAARPGATRYDHARASVTALHRVGVIIAAGTDSNAHPGSVNAVPHGISLHAELQLLVDAGLSPAQALRAAGTVPARRLGLPDRGAVQPGLRADFLLLDADPTTDITATTTIRQVWVGGRPVLSKPTHDLGGH